MKTNIKQQQQQHQNIHVSSWHVWILLPPSVTRSYDLVEGDDNTRTPSAGPCRTSMLDGRRRHVSAEERSRVASLIRLLLLLIPTEFSLQLLHT